jgi:hypothetical protein
MLGYLPHSRRVQPSDAESPGLFRVSTAMYCVGPSCVEVSIGESACDRGPRQRHALSPVCRALWIQS